MEIGLTTTNFVQSIGERVFGTWGGPDDLPKVDDKLVSVGCIFTIRNGLERPNKLYG
jgi:hypothetical protein